jgi:hypothetical protein
VGPIPRARELGDLVLVWSRVEYDPAQRNAAPNMGSSAVRFSP